MGIEKKASLICVVVLAILFGIGLANREERPSNETAKVLRDRDPRPVPKVVSSKPLVPVKPKLLPRPQPQTEPAYKYVEVRVGDSYSKIAKRELGSHTLHEVLSRANPETPPRRLRPGQKIRVPLGAPALAARIASGNDEKPVADIEKPEAGEPLTYAVRRNDTLSGISQRFYRRAGNWRKIWQANKAQVPDPDRLKPGIVLTIPR